MNAVASSLTTPLPARCAVLIASAALSGSAPAQPSCCAPQARAANRVAPTAQTIAALVAHAAPPPHDDTRKSPAPDGMVWIPPGEFAMGSAHQLSRPDERPIHRVAVDGFWMDRTEVTNAQFAEFVKATGYVTVAERPVDWEEIKKQLPPGVPRPADAALLPGSLVFTPPDHLISTEDATRWWTWTTGADWRHPDGPNSNIDKKEHHPVVHVAYEDALAYAAWAGKRLPTEAQWEYAARGGIDGASFTWGDDPINHTRANTWQGSFPHDNSADDGFTRTAPVGSFPPNGFGLVDMAGNVWEWCSDLYRPDAYEQQLLAAGDSKVIRNPTGPDASLDPRNPHAPESRVHRGGSFLCHDSYCASYRPSARMAAPPDTGMQHLGFRCVKSGNPPSPAPPAAH